MAIDVSSKYHLKSVHDEIGLYDRKLAHLLKFEKFETDEQRDQAARKLNLKRNSLVQTAMRLAAEGVEFKPSDLPASLRPAGAEVIETAQVEDEPKTEAAQTPSSAEHRSDAPYAGLSLDWQESVAQYMANKKKKS